VDDLVTTALVVGRHVLAVLAWIAFCVGAWLCATNCYLSFVRYPLHRLRGLTRESYHWVSGIPLFGTLFVALALLSLHSTPWILPAGVALILADTGGIHWCVGTLIFHAHDDKRP
jgi:hypothetical protein